MLIIKFAFRPIILDMLAKGQAKGKNICMLMLFFSFLFLCIKYASIPRKVFFILQKKLSLQDMGICCAVFFCFPHFVHIENKVDCVGREGSSTIGRKVAVFAVIPPFRRA